MKQILIILVATAALSAQTRIRTVYVDINAGMPNECVPKYILSAGVFRCQASGTSTSIAGDVTGTLAASVVSYVGTKTAAQVAQAVNATLAADSANTPSTIVMRGASGNFSAGTITANLTGNASTAAALQFAPTLCPTGQAPRGISNTGDPIGCTAVGGGGGGGTPGGTPNQIQFNNAGAFGGLDSTGTGNVLRESAVLGLGSGNGRKAVVQNATGTDTSWFALNLMPPFIAQNGGLDIISGQCAYRDTPDGGYFEGFLVLSSDGGSTLVSGSITMTIAAFDGTMFATLGTVSLSSQSSVVDTALIGWSTRTVAAGTNSRIRGCVTSVGSGMKYVTFAPRFRPI